MTKNLIDRLNKGPVICAEGFLFEMEKRGYLTSGEFVPMLALDNPCLLYTSPSPRDAHESRMPSSA